MNKENSEQCPDPSPSSLPSLSNELQKAAENFVQSLPQPQQKLNHKQRRALKAIQRKQVKQVKRQLEQQVRRAKAAKGTSSP